MVIYKLKISTVFFLLEMKMIDENNKKDTKINESTSILKSPTSQPQQQQQQLQKKSIPCYKQFSNLKKPTKLNLNTKTNENFDTKKAAIVKPINEQPINSSTSSTSINSFVNNNNKEDSAYSSLANSTINSQEIRSSPSKQKQQLEKSQSISPITTSSDSSSNSSEKNEQIIESIKYFKPILTPAKTQLKSFEIIEINENNNNNEICSNDESKIQVKSLLAPIVMFRNEMNQSDDIVGYSNVETNLDILADSITPTLFSLGNEFKRNSLATNLENNNNNCCDYVQIDLKTYNELIDDMQSTKMMCYKLLSVLKDNNCDIGDSSLFINSLLKVK
jgi:hypothetical protein